MTPESNPELTWLAAHDVTEDVGGKVNVERLKSVSRDFRSEFSSILTAPSSGLS